MKSQAERQETVAHKIINKLSTIIGNCDLLIEGMEQGTETAKRVAVIRDAAKTAVDELATQQQESAKRRARKAS